MGITGLWSAYSRQLVDDVIRRTTNFELSLHADQAGVIGIPDAIRGEVIKAFVSLRDGFEPSQDLTDELKRFVKSGLAAHAAPRVLKAKELGLPIGDVSTMED